VSTILIEGTEELPKLSRGNNCEFPTAGDERKSENSSSSTWTDFNERAVDGGMGRTGIEAGPEDSGNWRMSDFIPLVIGREGDFSKSTVSIPRCVGLMGASSKVVHI
jgi:hypothetical protein